MPERQVKEASYRLITEIAVICSGDIKQYTTTDMMVYWAQN